MKSFDAVIMIRLRHKPMQHTLDKDGVVLRIMLLSFSGCRYKSYSCSIRGLFGSAFFYEIGDPSGAPLPLQSFFGFYTLFGSDRIGVRHCCQFWSRQSCPIRLQLSRWRKFRCAPIRICAGPTDKALGELEFAYTCERAQYPSSSHRSRKIDNQFVKTLVLLSRSSAGFAT